MLAKMAPIAVAVDESVLPFSWPAIAKKLASPLVALEGATVGYDGRAVLSRLSLSLQADDRIGLIGANGNGKSTFAKLMGGRLDASVGQDGARAQTRSRFLRAASGRRPRARQAALTPMSPPECAASRRRRSAAGSRASAFPPARANTPVAELSGGEKARLLMGLATFEGPQLLILDEPTNHLDIDSRAELIEAINDYEGACILISHDRRLLEACAERLWLVANGGVHNFEGDLDDYARLVLGQPAAAEDRAATAEEHAVRANARAAAQ